MIKAKFTEAERAGWFKRTANKNTMCVYIIIAKKLKASKLATFA